jgi:GH43 family beta-xylosidase
MSTLRETASYTNPVYEMEFPDPFVLKYRGQYWGYCTGLGEEERVFGVMRSDDLVHWTPMGGAMTRPPGNWTQFWAPSVYHDNGTLFLYYSVGDGDHMEIRVATAARPDGPFTDCGHRLTSEDFAIDADLFVDDDGARYLTYASDFLEHTHVGTGIVIDRLLDPYTLSGHPQPVALPRYDWQIFDPARQEKGGVAWYTVEGPFVLKHKGKYYAMFSGGAWKTGAYAVGYAVTDDIRSADEWTQVADGRLVLPIMRSIPGKVLGPGHNSVVRGPDNRQLYCVYHRWSTNGAAEGTARVLAIDRLEWCGDRLIVLGPTFEPQPAPLEPSFTQGDGAPRTRANEWSFDGGAWTATGALLLQGSALGPAAVRHRVEGAAFVVECSLRALKGNEQWMLERGDSKGGAGNVLHQPAFGISFEAEDGPCLSVRLIPTRRCVVVGWMQGGRWEEQSEPLPPRFDVAAYHLARIEFDAMTACLSLEGVRGSWHCQPDCQPKYVTLHTQDAEAAFGGFSLTTGWANSFDQSGIDVEAIGWTRRGQDGRWRVQEGQLCGESVATFSTVEKDLPASSYEMVVNARLVDELQAGGTYGFAPAGRHDQDGPIINVVRADAGWVLQCRCLSSVAILPLPPDFEPTRYQHFRFWKSGTELTVRLEDKVLGRLPAAASPRTIGLHVDRSRAAFEMVRVTAITGMSE